MMDKAEYDNRMRDNRSFRYFGITPKWRPGASDVEGFIHDEVVRQGHDTEVFADGGTRCVWMHNAWEYARTRKELPPTLDDIRALGPLVEPHHNTIFAFRSMNVYIGDRMGVDPRVLERVMAKLATKVKDIIPSEGVSRLRTPLFSEFPETFMAEIDDLETADDWYLAYEWAHPWADGNGRTGKILHNWLLGTLHNPTLVKDYFGGGNP